MLLLVFFKFNFSIAAEPLPFNNIVLHKNPLQVSQVKFKDFDSKDIVLNKNDGKIKILNFWATWCAPCVEEMPMLSDFHNKTKKEGVSVIGLAIDNEKNVKEFLQKIQVDHHLLVAGGKGTNIMEKIGLNPSNSSPFTIMFDENYDLLEIKLGKLTLNELLYWVNTAER